MVIYSTIILQSLVCIGFAAFNTTDLFCVPDARPTMSRPTMYSVTANLGDVQGFLASRRHVAERGGGVIIELGQRAGRTAAVAWRGM